MTDVFYLSEPFTRNPFNRTELLNEMALRVQEFAEMKEALEESLVRCRPENLDEGQQPANVVIKGHIINPNPFSHAGLIGAHQWLYTLNRVTYVAGTEGEYTEGEVLATESAVNVRELGHFKATALVRGVAWGVDMDLTSYPSGFDAKAVGGSGTGPGHTHDVPTMAWSSSIDGETKWFFSEMGSHDGECE